MPRRSTEAALACAAVSLADRTAPEPAADPLGAARRSISFLETILESLCDGVLALDRRGRILYWSPSCERLTGIPAGAAAGREALEVLGTLGARLAEIDEGSVQDLLEVGQGQLPVGVTIVRATGPGGVCIGKVCAVTDMRGEWQERARRERLEALARLGKGVAWAVHQIRNPLGAAAGFTDLLERELQGASPAGLLEKVRESLREVERRIGEILTYVHPRPLQLVQTDLARLVARVAEDVKARFPKGPSVEAHLPGSLSLVADPEQLRQAIENLLVNASEAAGCGGRIVLLLQRGQPGPRLAEAGSVRLLIRNTGGDLSPKAPGALFEPFASTKMRGTGLGLPLAKRVVQAHGGEIEALSAGGWTTFVVTLPREAPIAARDGAPSAVKATVEI